MILENVNYSNSAKYLPVRQEKGLFGEVLIHLDLKGAPPKFEFLMDFISFFASGRGDKAGANKFGLVTGFLMEFEDTLPFKGNLECVRADSGIQKCYTVDQIKILVKRVTVELGLQLIPLVQVFSHLEYVLKRNQYKHLREEPDKMLSLCPMRDGSLELVQELID